MANGVLNFNLTQEEEKQRIDEAAKAGVDFAKLFYETMDKKRHLLGNLYLDTATLTWNGNACTGKADIIKFFETLPASETELVSVDAQAVHDVCGQGQKAIHVVTAGQVKFTGKSLAHFSNSFLLYAQETVWKIVVDTFRFHEPAQT